MKIIKRLCPICNDFLDLEYYIYAYGNTFRYWNDTRLQILCCYCYDIVESIKQASHITLEIAEEPFDNHINIITHHHGVQSFVVYLNEITKLQELGLL